MIRITRAEQDAIKERIKDAFFHRSKHTIFTAERADIITFLQKRRQKKQS